MHWTRRQAIAILASTLPAWRALRSFAAIGGDASTATAGPFQATRESLAAYRVPDWFRDAKFGIWAHWGPQSAAEFGDWYGRNLYIEGCRQYRHHVATYGHPSKFGYKDLIPTWKAEEFDAEALVSLYKQAGAKYFVSMGVHLDNFDLWNSRYTRWNAMNMGPKRDIVGEFRQAARNHGLKFGVSDHLWNSYKWFSVARGSDAEGPLAGVPYDGANAEFADLYGDCPTVCRDLPWNEDNIPEKWQRQWLARITDLVDQHQPDLVYSDGPIPFGDLGISLVAHYYNQAAQNGTTIQAVYTSKRPEDAAAGVCVLDVERDMLDEVSPQPWQTCTCVGNWHYDREAKYKTPKRVIDLLVDVVSRNGNLLLNFPLRSNGALDENERSILAEITQWMHVNGEAIHGTRPWKMFGAGPTVQKRDPAQKYGEASRQDLTAADIRFTTKSHSLFAIVMGWPRDRRVVIPSLGTGQPNVAGRVRSVELLGHPGTLEWKQEPAGLTVRLPAEAPSQIACALRIEGLEIA